MVSFSVTKEEHEIIAKIAERAVKEYAKHGIELEMRVVLMDITACHANSVRLKLQELLEAPDFDFAHDISGIRRHLNRRTGQLEDCFLPRTAE